jgi:hypothetical protein
MTNITIVKPSQPSASERARTAWLNTQIQSRVAVLDAVAVLAEGAERAADCATLPGLSPGITDDLRRLSEAIAPVLIRVNSMLGRKL